MKYKSSEPVLADLYISKINKLLPTLMRRAQITKHITFYCFRHTFAMHLQETGADIYSIAPSSVTNPS
jgi:site-specific recombinase XerD